MTSCAGSFRPSTGLAKGGRELLPAVEQVAGVEPVGQQAVAELAIDGHIVKRCNIDACRDVVASRSRAHLGAGLAKPFVELADRQAERHCEVGRSDIDRMIPATAAIASTAASASLVSI